VKLKVVVMGVFMVKVEERESERALRGHVACGSKGQTTGVLGYVYVCKDMVGILYKLIPLFSNYLFFFFFFFFFFFTESSSDGCKGGGAGHMPSNLR
jgi:hypothetical protein